MVNIQAWAAANAVKLLLGLAVILILTASHGYAYIKGKQAVTTELAREEAAMLNKELTSKNKEIELAKASAAAAATKVTEQDARIESATEAYNEAVDRAGANLSCDLSDDELRELKRIAEG